MKMNGLSVKRGFKTIVLGTALAPALAVAMPAVAIAQPLAPAVQSVLGASGDNQLIRFYGTRDHRPIWIRNGFIAPDALRLVELLREGEIDGFREGPALAASLDRVIANAQSGDPRDLARAELMLSRALVDYVQTLRRPVDVGMHYADVSVSPSTPSVPEILQAAAAAPSLARHIGNLPNINPLYTQLRQALAALRTRSSGFQTVAFDDFGENPAAVERRLMLNLDRARALPTNSSGRYILVDAASQRLWLYEDGQPVDSMKVIVGKPGHATPMIASVISTAVLNPYWNVPPDLVQRNIAPRVLSEGLGYLRSSRYEVLSDWTENARVVDPGEVDWEAVAAGQRELRVRQLPGGANAMGDVKFPFPNRFGVYLHDTPEKNLFAEAQRNLSSGCVRLEDAERLSKWLFGTRPQPSSPGPEQIVALPQAVPVYITYLTVGWNGEKLAIRNDPYGRDSTVSGYASAGQLAAAD